MNLSRKKGKNYINTMPKNRILKTLVNFDIAIICFIITNLVLKRSMHLKQILLSFIGWDSVGNSNWYIFAILGLYCITFLSFKAYEKGKTAVISTWILTSLFILFLYIFKGPHQGWWFNTLFCYPLGLTYSYNKEKIEKIVCKDNYSYLVSLLIAFVATFVCTYMKKGNFYYYELWGMSFVILIVFITMKANINNSILKWLGENLFWLYILQRIPMIVLKEFKFNIVHPYLFFILSLVITIILTIIFKYTVDKLINKLFKKA